MTISIKQLLSEAKSPFNIGDKVHVGTHGTSTPGGEWDAELGTVTKTNGFGHTHVKTDSGKEHVFNSDNTLRSETSKHNLKVRPIEQHEADKAILKKKNDEYAVKMAAEAKHKSEEIAKHAPVHKEIIDKIKQHSGDEHLKNLGEPQHEFDRHNNYYGSTTSSEIKDHPFKDLFHKITKDVTIRQASPKTTAEDGITHFGRVQYNYQHPGSGSNGHEAYDFNRHTDGHIEICKPVHEGTTQFGGDNWTRKVTNVIK